MCCLLSISVAILETITKGQEVKQETKARPDEDEKHRSHEIERFEQRECMTAIISVGSSRRHDVAATQTRFLLRSKLSKILIDRDYVPITAYDHPALPAERELSDAIETC